MFVCPFRHPVETTRRVIVACLAMTLLAGCGASSAGDDSLHIVASFYPLTFAAREVAGDDARVIDLTPPGAEPHDIELTARQVVDASEADLLIYLGSNFQPAVEELTTSFEANSLDALEGLHRREQHPTDPHVWLDPTLMSSIVDALATRLAAIDPDQASSYRRRAQGLVDELDTLDGEFREGFGKCRRRELVVSHEAFGYLADRYGLTQVGISGLDPEAEPSPSRLAEVADYVREHGVTTIFFETLVSPRVAQALARESGAAVAALDPLEGAPEQGDYLSAMRANLRAIRKGLGCS